MEGHINGLKGRSLCYMADADIRKYVEEAAAKLHPFITEAWRASNPEEAADYENIAAPLIDSAFIPSLSPFVAHLVNSVCQQVVEHLANVEGSKTVITRHDPQGRILELVIIPLWSELGETAEPENAT